MTSSHCRVATERMKVRKHLILFCRSFLGWELSRARWKGGGVKSSGAETTPSTQADSTLVNVYQVGKFKEETSVLSVPMFLLPLLFAKLCSAPAQETPVKQDQVLSYFHSFSHNSALGWNHSYFYLPAFSLVSLWNVDNATARILIRHVIKILLVMLLQKWSHSTIVNLVLSCLTGNEFIIKGCTFLFTRLEQDCLQGMKEIVAT